MTTLAPLSPAQSPDRFDPRSWPQRFVLRDVTWSSYVAIGTALSDRPALRLTFDQGTLELMTTSPQHEFFKKRLARMIETMAEEFGFPLATAGNMTFQRDDVERGMEADDCFWIAHEVQMRGRLDWNPQRDPAPDLVMEIEISRSVLDRLGILASLGVRDVWAFDGQELRVYVLQPDQTYQQVPQSPTFPLVPLAHVAGFLAPNPNLDYLALIRSFRQWLQALPRPTTP